MQQLPDPSRYYIGTKIVWLTVGHNSNEGSFDDIMVSEEVIDKDYSYIEILRNGIKLLDDNWDNLNLESRSGQRTCCPLKPEVELMTNYLQEIKRLEVMIEEKKITSCNSCKDNGVKSINSENYIITNVPAGTTSRFNKGKAIKRLS